MSARIIDGTAVAARVEAELKEPIGRLGERGIQPALVTVRVGEDPASEIYVRNKVRKANELGIRGEEKHLEATISAEDLLAVIHGLNADPEIDGILLQLPIPGHLDSRTMIEAIDPAKDVDGFHPMNVGRLHLGQTTLVPCTPAGVIRLIESTGEPISGKRAVVVGRSDIVGKPAASLLLARHATVTICHSRTHDLGAVVREGEIVIAAVGRPLLIDRSMIRPGAIVIDVGVNRILPGTPAASLLKTADPKKFSTLEAKGRVLAGDVAFPGASEVAGWITPVPGGVGPMTIAMLMANTVRAAEARRR
ncbi:MAG: bifunctional 5,10-methylenetetrahydrofolate dehydrogenase/5,10-methenyltetrahydrofolate cyclohydrolase [Thermoanaerobaculia bacterium]